MTYLQRFVAASRRSPTKAVGWIIRQVKILAANLLPGFIKFLIAASRELVALRAVIDWAIESCAERLSYAVMHPSRPF